MRYSCLAPGKRIRPALCLLAAEAVDPSLASQALDAACALEMVHAFSLIHDDLPALDNDDLRRGRPTCHIEFGESTAILAGDALFALAFQTLAEAKAEPATVVAAIQTLARATGSLVGGEVVDLESEGKTPTEAQLEFIHINKTGALIEASCRLGGLFADASKPQRESLTEFGKCVGLAFQIADDVLNEVSTPEALGKAAGSDRERSKATYPALFGLEASRQKALDLANQAQSALGPLGAQAQPLAAVALYAVERLR